MADRYLGVDVGGTGPADVTAAAATNSADIELVIVDTNLPDASADRKLRVLEGLEAIKMKIQEDTGF